MHTMMSDWAATTVGGIKIGDLLERSQLLARIGVINMCLLCAWLTVSLATCKRVLNVAFRVSENFQKLYIMSAAAQKRVAIWLLTVLPKFKRAHKAN